MEQLSKKDVLKFASMACGVLFVNMDSIQLMAMSSAHNLATMELVSKPRLLCKCVCFILFNRSYSSL